MIKLAVIDHNVNREDKSLNGNSSLNGGRNMRNLINSYRPVKNNEDEDEENQIIVFNIQFIGHQEAELLRKIKEKQTKVCFILSDEENELTDQEKFLTGTHTVILNNKANISLLTRREIDIMNHLSKGLLYKEIAKDLGISMQTVKNHLKKIYSKFRVSNRSEAIIKYINFPDNNLQIYTGR
jgi:DNA-binding CsgD family transcriptional regulator